MATILPHYLLPAVEWRWTVLSKRDICAENSLKSAILDKRAIPFTGTLFRQARPPSLTLSDLDSGEDVSFT